MRDACYHGYHLFSRDIRVIRVTLGEGWLLGLTLLLAHQYPFPSLGPKEPRVIIRMNIRVIRVMLVETLIHESIDSHQDYQGYHYI